MVFVTKSTAFHQWKMLDITMSAAFHQWQMLGITMSAAFHQWQMLDITMSAAFHHWKMLGITMSAAFHQWKMLDITMSAAFHQWKMLGITMSAAFHQWQMLGITMSAAFHQWKMLGITKKSVRNAGGSEKIPYAFARLWRVSLYQASCLITFVNNGCRRQGKIHSRDASEGKNLIMCTTILFRQDLSAARLIGFTAAQGIMQERRDCLILSCWSEII